MPMRRCLAALALCLAVPAAAEAPDPPPGVASVTLLPGWRQADGTHVAAVAIELAPGWKTYWRAPGAAGLPPQFDWSGSRNLAAAEPDWPRPHRFETLGIPTLGYADELVLPLVLRPERAGAPIALELEMFFGVCDEICVPAEARLAAVLTADAPPQGRARIEAALAKRPVGPEAAGVAAATCRLVPARSGHALVAEIAFDAALPPGQTAVIESDGTDLWVGATETRIRGRTVEATAPVEPDGAAPMVLARDGLTLTVLDARRAVEIRGCAGPG